MPLERSNDGLIAALNVVDEQIREYFIRAANVCTALEVLGSSTFDKDEQYATLTEASMKYSPSIERFRSKGVSIYMPLHSIQPRRWDS